MDVKEVIEVRQTKDLKQFVVTHYGNVIIITTNYDLANIVYTDLKESDLPASFRLQL